MDEQNYGTDEFAPPGVYDPSKRYAAVEASLHGPRSLRSKIAGWLCVAAGLLLVLAAATGVVALLAFAVKIGWRAFS